MNCYKEYSAIKMLIDEYFYLQKDKSYEEFIAKLVDILQI